MDWMDGTVLALRDALAARQVSSAVLVAQCIDRTRQAGTLNAYAAFDEDALRLQAQAADARLAAGERLPLLGVPIALKDNIEAVGFACGNGTRVLHGHPARRDAALVQRLRAAGALISGKAGMHELAFGVTSNNAVTGAIRNPWNPAYSPGGSSGGSAAVVAAGLVPAAIGTDTGGSIRIPAAFCGIAGFRPGLGRVSNAGVAPIAAKRDVAGPLAHSVADLALLDGVLTADSAPLPEIALRGLRLGVPEVFWQDLTPEVEAVAQAALAQLRDAGAVLVPMAFHGLEKLDAHANFAEVLFEFQRDMPRYLQERDPSFRFDELLAQVGSPDVRALLGSLQAGKTAAHDALQLAQAGREQLLACYRAAFAQAGIAAMVFPTVPCTAPGVGEDEAVLIQGRSLPLFPTITRNTDPGSHAGLPGLSMPVGESQGLPVGMEIDGLPGMDKQILAIGMALESVWPRRPLPAALRENWQTA